MSEKPGGIPRDVAPPTPAEHRAAHEVADNVAEGKQGQAVKNPIARFNEDLPVHRPVRDHEGKLIDVTSFGRRALRKLVRLARGEGIKPEKTTDDRLVLTIEEKHPNHGFVPKYKNEQGQFVNVNGEVLPPLPALEPSERVIREIQSPKRLLVPQGEPDAIQVKKWDELPDDVPESEGQRLEVHTANRSHFGMGETVISWSGNHGNIHGLGESQERLFVMAERLPDYGLVAINPPQVGESDGMTPEQRRDVLNQVAHAELRIMKELGVESAVFAGQSMGAELALLKAMHAHEYDIAVENVILEELPDDPNTLRLMKNTLHELGTTLLRAHTRGNTRLTRAAGLLKSQFEQVKDNLRFQKRMVTKTDPLLRYGRALAHPHNQKYATNLLTNQVGSRKDFGDLRIGDFLKITFVNGSESTVSPLTRINPMIDELKAMAAGRFADNIDQVIIPGAGHLATVAPEDNAAIINHVLHGSALPRVSKSELDLAG